jgi:uncharacterized protein YccT (UPF0319 family)
MKTKEDYKRAQLVVKKVIDSWDPYALLDGGAPDDEFSEEINQIVRRVPQIRSENDAIQVISSVMSAAFDAENFTSEKCTETGKKLFARCKEECLI